MDWNRFPTDVEAPNFIPLFLNCRPPSDPDGSIWVPPFEADLTPDGFRHTHEGLGTGVAANLLDSVIFTLRGTSMLRLRFIGSFAIGLTLSLALVGTTRADPPNVTRLIHGFGGATDVAVAGVDHGSIGLAGELIYSHSGDLTSVNIALTYQDSESVDDGMTCLFTSKTDVSIAGGILLLTPVGTNDKCFQTTSVDTLINNTDGFISFYIFGDPSTGAAQFVGLSVNLKDAQSDFILSQTVVGTIETVK